MQHLRRSKKLTAVLAVLLSIAYGTALPQVPLNWPKKPVHIVVPCAPGCTPDVLARGLAPSLANIFGNEFLVDNVDGEAGRLAAVQVAKSPADGYTLLMGTVGTQAILPALHSELGYDTDNDFAPIVFVAAFPRMLVINSRRAAALKIASLDGLIGYMHSHPGKLTLASGDDRLSSLAGVMFEIKTRTRFDSVFYGSSSSALLATAGGDIDLAFAQLPAALAEMQAGRVVGLAVTSSKRSPAAPDLPTVAMAGPVKGYEATSWAGLLARAGTSTEIVGVMQNEVLKIMADPDQPLKALLRVNGAVRSGGTSSANFARFLAVEKQKWDAVVRASPPGRTEKLVCCE